MSQFYTSVDHFALVPAIMLALFACAVFLFDFLVFPEPRQRKWLLLFVTLVLLRTETEIDRRRLEMADLA